MRAVVKGFAPGDRGQLIMACGPGKTLTSLFAAEHLEAKWTIVLVPRCRCVPRADSSCVVGPPGCLSPRNPESA